MEQDLQLMIQMNEWTWKRFMDALKDVTPEEAEWRPLPEANNINAILRHLRIEAHWHVASLECGESLPGQVAETDLEPLDFERNLKELEESYTRFIETLRRMPLAAVEEQTLLAYRSFPDASRPTHLLGFHQALHLATHPGADPHHS